MNINLLRLKADDFVADIYVVDVIIVVVVIVVCCCYHYYHYYYYYYYYYYHHLYSNVSVKGI